MGNRKSEAGSAAYPAEILWMLACAAVLAWKLLLPGFIGMADNGDFGKVIAPLCLASDSSQAENFFHAVHLRDSRNCLHPLVPTSEIALAGTASALQSATGDRRRFDIRWLGALHALLFLGCYFAILRLLRALPALARFSLSLFALWIFADIVTLAYFNSFYSDVAAILGGLAAAFLAVELLSSERPSPLALAIFAAAALLLITSKAQHGVFGFLPAALVLYAGWRSARALAFALAALLLAATVWIVAATPGWYKAEARFNLIFYRLLPESPSPARDLAELGLTPGDARYIGLNSFTHGGPMDDQSWMNRFRLRCTYSHLVHFYLRHPQRALALLRDDLKHDAWQRRPPGLANYRKESGMPEGAFAASLGSWSDLRSALARHWPAQAAIWLVLLPIAALWFVARQPRRSLRAIASTMAAVALLALGEFALAALTDTLETPRHLTMFHIYTDVVIFLGLVLAAHFAGKLPMLVALAVFAVLVARYEISVAAAPLSPAHWDPAGAVDDANPAIVYSGDWTAGKFQSAFAGTLTFTDRTGATADLSFDGTSFQYVFTRAPNRGVAQVWIDGILRQTVDLYSPQIVWQAHLAIGGLSPGPHRAAIRAAGRHNSASSGNFIDLDALCGR